VPTSHERIKVSINPTNGENEILCSNGGVEFVEAAADVELRELNLYEPYQSIAKFVPMKKHGVFAIQVIVCSDESWLH